MAMHEADELANIYVISTKDLEPRKDGPEEDKVSVASTAKAV